MRLKRHYFAGSLLLHLLLLLSLTVSWVATPPPMQQTPNAVISSYTYQPPVSSAANASQNNSQKNELIDKASNGPAIKMTSQQQQQRYANQLKQIRFEKNIQAVPVSDVKEKEPLRLIGDSKIVKPLAKILGRALSKNLSYPKIAVDFNIRGIVYIGFALHPDGRVTDVQIVKSSGAGVLDAAALTAVNAISPVKEVDSYIKEAEFLVVGIIFG